MRVSSAGAIALSIGENADARLFFNRFRLFINDDSSVLVLLEYFARFLMPSAAPLTELLIRNDANINLAVIPSVLNAPPRPPAAFFVRLNTGIPFLNRWISDANAPPAVLIPAVTCPRVDFMPAKDFDRIPVAAFFHCPDSFTSLPDLSILAFSALYSLSRFVASWIASSFFRNASDSSRLEPSSNIEERRSLYSWSFFSVLVISLVKSR